MLLLVGFASAQQVDIRNFTVSEDGILTLEYLIKASHSQRETYTVHFYSSADNFQSKWDFKQENIAANKVIVVTLKLQDHLPSNFQGNLQFRLKAEATTFPVRITAFDEKVKMNAQTHLAWVSSRNDSNYDIKLVRQGETIFLAKNYQGVHFNGKLPEGIGKGKYELYVVPTGNSSSQSDPVAVQVAPKMGMGMKVAGALILGGGGLLAGMSQSEGSGTTGTLPTAPGPPSN
jgi:hypothetical protein